MIPLSKGFAPDAPNDEPNSITAATNIVPTQYGMKRALQRTILSTAATSAGQQRGRGAKTLYKLDGTTRTFAAVVDTVSILIKEYSGGSWTDRSSGGGYTSSNTSNWSFAQFGDTSLAIHLNTPLQYSNSGAFTNLATAPQADVMEVLMTSGGGFAMLFNTVDGTYGTSQDRWWCSALNDATSSTAWTPSIATQCATGRLLGTPGPITAAKQLGSDRIVAYKADSAYVGQYVGPPGVFTWQELPGIGCVGKDAVVDTGGVHFVVNREDVYLFDGASFRSIGQGIRDYIRTNTYQAAFWMTTAIYDRENDSVRIFAAQNSVALQYCYVYHIKRGVWGIDNISGSNYEFSPFLYPSSSSYIQDTVAALDADNKIITFDGTPSGTTDITLPAIGDENYTTILKSVRVKFATSPSAATAVVSKNASFGASQNSDFSQAAYDSPGSSYGIFNFRSTAKWHYVTLTLTGPFEILGYEYELERVGRR